MQDWDSTRIPAAGNGLLDRRLFLRATTSLFGGGLLLSAQAAGAPRAAWSVAPGAPLSGYGKPSAHEHRVQRVGIGSQPGTTGSGASRTPLERLEGTVTPSGLHFERHHSGVPAIDPEQHSLVIHGLVRRPLRFSMASLTRYAMQSRLQFFECSGNSGIQVSKVPATLTCGEIHGLVSQSDWAGVPLNALLEEAGVLPQARWLIAEGADAARLSRSVPLAKAFDDALIALYQNGERLRPENGYPVRLFLPGYEGNMSVKWLQRIEVTAAPAMTRYETSKYSDLGPDGKAALFTFPMGVKSVITSPAPGLHMGEPGVYQISGLAWSGAGRVRTVEVSADGGRSWAPAHLDEPPLPQALCRFRCAWRWNGAPCQLLSRATDETGAVQPTRAALVESRAPGAIYHFNGIQAWQIDAAGEIHNAFV
ncbi:MAG: sulfite dehydrogenase [Pseudomonadales bacterium]|nr:sulfite dehydrogenase [Pseudomonadales bacterium]